MSKRESKSDEWLLRELLASSETLTQQLEAMTHELGQFTKDLLATREGESGNDQPVS